MNVNIPVEALRRDIHEIEQVFSLSTHFVLTTHMNPDADAIGSTCALALALRSRGKNVRIVNTSVTPENLRFLPGSESIEVFDESIHATVLAQVECIICLDLNAPKRTGKLEQGILQRKDAVVMIDHHTDPQDFFAHSLHDIEATSTAELVYKFLAAVWPENLSADIATNIYAGIMADTGNFRFPRVCAATHYIVAELIEQGADPVRIYDQMFNTWPIDKARLIAEASANMTLEADGRLCVMRITNEMLERHHCNEEAIEGAVQQTLGIAGVKCGLLISQRPSSNEVKLSFRSKGDFYVNRIAAQFGGGGHIYAAGARVSGEGIDSVQTRAVAAVQKAFEGEQA